eukprot:TRINITY_DN974_c0_g2_i1.p1 TRINITY_DN974_c0_g2~~TRINITY_DN974_c0_g2_i1.p1  ORF type:complete len:456 (+),score=83.06 TRINITY_DN974_c0_g2_i1:215-1582(+)
MASSEEANGAGSEQNIRPNGFRLTPDMIGGDEVFKPAHLSQFIDESEITWFPSALPFTPVQDDESIVVDVVKSKSKPNKPPREFLRGGPRPHNFFDPKDVKVAIVTCGGICPGLNSVIRELVMCLHYSYDVRDVWGVRFGYEGFYSHAWVPLNPGVVGGIHHQGGTILGTCRGGFDLEKIMNSLLEKGINVVFTIGGDGTHKGANVLFEEIKRRKLKISIVGIPKTIDNDIPHIDKSFGFDTAVSKAVKAIKSAHVEVKSATNGVGLVLLMGRNSGFIAMEATLSSGEVNAAFIPEVKFKVPKILEFLETRLTTRGHAVLVVAEGAGADIFAVPDSEKQRDKSGNVILPEIGLYLRNQIKAHFKHLGIEINMKYIDPSYMIRSVAPNPADYSYTLVLAHNAVYAAMAGYSGFTVAMVNTHYCLLPLSQVAYTRKVDPQGREWQRVLEITGQPHFE